VRRKYLSNLNNWINDENRKPLVLRGARQVGKSTLVRLFAAERGLRLLEINLERNKGLNRIFASLHMKNIISALEDVFGRSIDPKRDLLFLDEIQATPQALAALRYFYEDLSELPVIGAGSLLEFAFLEEKFSVPVGRIDYLHIFPLIFTEFLEALGESHLAQKIANFRMTDEDIGLWNGLLHEKLMGLLREYQMVGGMPEAVQAFINKSSPKKIQKIQQSILATYQDDFAKYARQSDWQRLLQTFQRVPGIVGQKVKYTEIDKSDKAANIKRCIDLLNHARLIEAVHHSDCSGLPLASMKDPSIFKLYFLDVGLLNAMQKSPWSLDPRTWETRFQGVQSEQFVAQQILGSEESQTRPELHYWLRDGQKGNAEVDFVIQMGDYMAPVEVKSSKAGHLKSIQQFVARKKSPIAVRFNTGLPRKESVAQNILSTDGMTHIRYILVTLPLYLAECLSRIEEHLQS
jgi:predicted AAA+ superfamily ATPase